MNNREKSKQPIFFVDKEKGYHVNPIYMIDEEINSRDRFVITRTTDNGGWVRGGMLYYKLEKVEIFTDINNAIFVDLDSNIVFVKEYEKVIEQVQPIEPEQRQYIILMYFEDDECKWESMIGRQTTYDWIKTYIDLYGFDPDKSLVITDNIAFKDAFSVSRFVKHLQNSNLVEEDGFDIEQYIVQIDE